MVDARAWSIEEQLRRGFDLYEVYEVNSRKKVLEFLRKSIAGPGNFSKKKAKDVLKELNAKYKNFGKVALCFRKDLTDVFESAIVQECIAENEQQNVCDPKHSSPLSDRPTRSQDQETDVTVNVRTSTACAETIRDIRLDVQNVRDPTAMQSVNRASRKLEGGMAYRDTNLPGDSSSGGGYQRSDAMGGQYDLETRLQRLEQEKSALLETNERLKAENAQVANENRKMRGKNTELLGAIVGKNEKIAELQNKTLAESRKWREQERRLLENIMNEVKRGPKTGATSGSSVAMLRGAFEVGKDKVLGLNIGGRVELSIRQHKERLAELERWLGVGPCDDDVLQEVCALHKHVIDLQDLVIDFARGYEETMADACGVLAGLLACADNTTEAKRPHAEKEKVEKEERRRHLVRGRPDASKAFLTEQLSNNGPRVSEGSNPGSSWRMESEVDILDCLDMVEDSNHSGSLAPRVTSSSAGGSKTQLRVMGKMAAVEGCGSASGVGSTKRPRDTGSEIDLTACSDDERVDPPLEKKPYVPIAFAAINEPEAVENDITDQEDNVEID